MLKNGIVKKKESIEFLNIIDNNSKQLINLIDDIIDISKIETNKLKIEYGDCNIVELLESIHKIYSHVKLYRDKDHLEVNYPIPENHEDLHIRTNRFGLEYVLINLSNTLSNFQIMTLLISGLLWRMNLLNSTSRIMESGYHLLI